MPNDQAAQIAQAALQAPINNLVVLLALIALLIVIGVGGFIWRYGPKLYSLFKQQADTNKLNAETTAKLTEIAEQNRHATATFLLGLTSVAGSYTATTAKTKTTGGTNGATLDIITATWAASNGAIAASLRGRAGANTIAW